VTLASLRIFFFNSEVLRGVPNWALEHLRYLLNENILDFLGRVHTFGEPLYSSTRDGASAAAFHGKCDNQGPTLTLIKDTDGNVFGGYTAVSWTDGGFVGFSSTRDPLAFLVRVVSPYNTAPIVFPSTGNVLSVRSFKNNGPWFGGGICVSYNDLSYTRIDGLDYVNPTGVCGNVVMTGTPTFTPAVVEVFAV
jgi:hypothetical protein